MRILETQEYDEIFSWNRKGNAVVIHKPSHLIGEVLTKHFDAKEGMKFDSFLRKLYRWGFAKHVISEGERGGDEGEHIYAHSVSNFDVTSQTIILLLIISLVNLSFIFNFFSAELPKR